MAKTRTMAKTVLIAFAAAHVSVAAAQPGSPAVAYFPPPSAQPKLSCPPGSAFPPHSPVAVSAFEAQWYSKHLAAAGEPSLYLAAQRPNPPGARVLRFTLLPSFDPPVIVRVVWQAGAAPQLIASLSSGLGGYGAGKNAAHLDRPLTGTEAARLDAVLVRTHPFDPAEAECALGLDGAEWVVEEVGPTGYRVVRRWSPRDGRVRELGLALLAMTGWQFKRMY